MYYKLLNLLQVNLDEIPEEYLKNLVNGIVEKIEIYLEPRNGAWIKSVQFKVGLNVENLTANADGGNSLPSETTDETIVLLSHKSPDSVINATVEFGEGAGKVPLNEIAEPAKKYQPKPKVTYKMIQEYVEKKYGFKVHTAYIAEVKRALGLTMHDASNEIEELKQQRKLPPKEKVEAITEALKYYEVI